MAEWTGSRRSGIAYGKLSGVRKLLRRLPDELTEEVRKAFTEGAEKILEEARYNVLAQGLYDSGKLLDSLDIRFGRDGLSARIGLVTAKGRKQGWYGKFHEYGTKGGVIATREGKRLEKPINIPPLPARPFLGPAFDANRDEVSGMVQKAIRRALNQAAGMAGGANSMAVEIHAAGGEIGIDE